MYYLTHDNAGHQVFLLKEDSDINTIKEDIEEGAIAYVPANGAINVRIGGDWVEASTGGGGGGQPIISADVDFHNYSITNLNELYAELVQLSDAVQIEAHDDRLVLNANDGEGGWSAPVRVFGVSSDPEYADEVITKGFFDTNKTNIITGNLFYNSQSEQYEFTPDFMPNTRCAYVNELFTKGIDSKIFITSGEWKGYVCRLIMSSTNYYVMQCNYIPNPGDFDAGYTSIVIYNRSNDFTVELYEV